MLHLSLVKGWQLWSSSNTFTLVTSILLVNKKEKVLSVPVQLWNWDSNCERFNIISCMLSLLSQFQMPRSRRKRSYSHDFSYEDNYRRHKRHRGSTYDDYYDPGRSRRPRSRSRRYVLLLFVVKLTWFRLIASGTKHQLVPVQ